MNKKNLSILLAIFLLVQHIPLHSLSAETFSLNPYTKVSPKEIDISIIAVTMALAIYKMDAVDRRPKQDIMTRCAPLFANFSQVRFDLEHMDIRKKGWTRYYPFSANGKDFIIRIFLTEERMLQPETAVLYEGSIERPRVTFQVLPCLNEILSACSIKPYNTSPTSPADSSV